MSSSSQTAFIQGIVAGAALTFVLGFILLYALPSNDLYREYLAGGEYVQRSLDWIYQNLGFSTIFFALILTLFLKSLNTLKHAVLADRPIDEIAQAEQMVDTWTNLFFGVGVIWTAIGMRGALIQALAEPDAALGQGAFAVLQRMVDGGILLALSTTILGGIGGYLMRVVKTLTVGTPLKRCYHRAARAQGEQIQETLQAIEARLETITDRNTDTEVVTHAQTAVGTQRPAHSV